MIASHAMKAALLTAPIVRLGETIEEFTIRYSRWYREERHEALALAVKEKI